MNNEDILAYYDQSSDLSFELEILKLVNANGLCIDHGGRYIDKVTEKIREFDILARPRGNVIQGIPENIAFYDIRLCIECKNVSPNTPIIVGARELQFDSVSCYRIDKIYGKPIAVYENQINIARLHKLVQSFGGYFLNYIGVEILQVVRKENGELKHPDRSGTYDKWSQAVNHAMFRYEEMFKRINGLQDGINGNIWAAPILVVPDGTLKLVALKDGKKEIADVNGVVFKVGARFDVKDMPWVDASISNLFVVTTTGLKSFLTLFSLLSN